jgi:hypothetical protein
MNAAAAGILLSISRHTYEPEAEEPARAAPIDADADEATGGEMLEGASS